MTEQAAAVWGTYFYVLGSVFAVWAFHLLWPRRD